MTIVGPSPYARLASYGFRNSASSALARAGSSIGWSKARVRTVSHGLRNRSIGAGSLSREGVEGQSLPVEHALVQRQPGWVQHRRAERRQRVVALIQGQVVVEFDCAAFRPQRHAHEGWSTGAEHTSDLAQRATVASMALDVFER